jgi:hypothetical protein
MKSKILMFLALLALFGGVGITDCFAQRATQNPQSGTIQQNEGETKNKGKNKERRKQRNKKMRQRIRQRTKQKMNKKRNAAKKHKGNKTNRDNRNKAKNNSN